ncbi:Xylose isomerase domain-containing protein TIM barrel [Methanobacterium paludis]|uniref:Xylose isomerase domain-containing protein TIM barrel n=2 Tax=Methanobacterium paludis (strain DSM 25820 / JCM 18151 / SWAN1) TaxID=868131 RepID=F6D7D7_METPW|nr:Xylose isomerase domain-containing protein TIM barrel [Methanobacterium paludis]
MKIGFSTLALFANSFDEWIQTATDDNFQIMEILCEGPWTWPRNAMKLCKDSFEVFKSSDIDLFLHAPTIDLNPASLNTGIREETLRQLMETVDMAVEIGAVAITTHPGLIHRLEDRVRNMGMHFAVETLKKANEYAEDRGIILSVENMPNKYAYFCNSAAEHQYFVDECGCHATVDIGHANTTGDPESFLQINGIYYYHLSDNNGEKDQHLSLGEGNLDLDIINGIDNVIIELNNYESVLKSREILLNGFK